MGTDGIGGVGARLDRATSPLDLDTDDMTNTVPEEHPGSLSHLLNQVSPLDRLVADAGDLAKFRADQTDAMPSGTSSFTLRIPDAMARIDARMAEPHQRVLGSLANPANRPQQPPPVPSVDPAKAPIEPALRSEIRSATITPRPDVRADTDSQVSRMLRGTSSGRGA